MSKPRQRRFSGRNVTAAAGARFSLCARKHLNLRKLRVYGGQALLLSSVALVVYAACISAAFHAFVRLYEEPALTKTYGEEYRAYCANGAPWIPRLTPWRRH